MRSLMFLMCSMIGVLWLAGPAASEDDAKQKAREAAALGASRASAPVASNRACELLERRAKCGNHPPSRQPKKGNSEGKCAARADARRFAYPAISPWAPSK